ncbi:MAG: hypothetical protein HOC18_04990 [Candidatus Marinimicrobia bacterium]|jgi:hypothetical protein|nr:hypothetical protein [Candidatus Neomarinimicrobiota bacterium]
MGVYSPIVLFMKKEYTLEEKVEYLQYKVDHDDTPYSEKIEILEFFGHCTGLFSTELGPDEFNQVLDRLTRDFSQNPNDI